MPVSLVSRRRPARLPALKTPSLTRAFSAGIPPDVVQSRPATYAKGLVASAPFRHRPATAGPDMAERKEMRVNDTPVVKGPTAQSRAPEPQHSATWRSLQVSPCLCVAKTITASGAAINATGIVQNGSVYDSSLSRIKSRKFFSFRGPLRRGPRRARGSLKAKPPRAFGRVARGHQKTGPSKLGLAGRCPAG